MVCSVCAARPGVKGPAQCVGVVTLPEQGLCLRVECLQRICERLFRRFLQQLGTVAGRNRRIGLAQNIAYPFVRRSQAACFR